MLFNTVLASLVAFTSVAMADTNASRFRRGLPPLAPKKAHDGLARRVFQSATPHPNIPVRSLLVQTADSDVPNWKFSSAINRNYNDYDLAPLTGNGMSGTFVFSGYYSSDNNQPIYFFKPSTGNTVQPYLTLNFAETTSTLDSYEGAYFSLGAGGNSPYAPTDRFMTTDPNNVYTEAAVFQIDRTNPSAPALKFLTIDNENYEWQASEICIDGLGSEDQLPFLWTGCEPTDIATVTLELA